MKASTSKKRFQLPRIRLTFEGTIYDELEIVCKPLSLGEFRRFATLIDSEQDLLEGKLDEKELNAALETLASVGDGIVSWNLHDDNGDPITPSREAFEDLDLELAFTILEKRANVQTEVPAPLGETSSAGSPSQEVTIPMEPLSPNLGSSPKQNGS